MVKTYDPYAHGAGYAHKLADKKPHPRIRNDAYWGLRQRRYAIRHLPPDFDTSMEKAWIAGWRSERKRQRGNRPRPMGQAWTEAKHPRGWGGKFRKK